MAKSEDRHGVTNLTYSMSDFLNEMGYKSHMENYVDYNKRIDKSIGSLKALASGKNRNAAADYLIRIIKRRRCFV